MAFEQTTRLSAFGEHPAYSLDGKRIAFIGKSYGDAFEIELATGKVRNLTVNFPKASWASSTCPTATTESG